MAMLRLYRLVSSQVFLSAKELCEVWRTAADLGGFLGGKDLAQAEALRWRMAAELLAAPGLTEAERAKILAEVREREAKALGEENADPTGFDVEDAEPKQDRGTDE